MHSNPDGIDGMETHPQLRSQHRFNSSTSLTQFPQGGLGHGVLDGHAVLVHIDLALPDLIRQGFHVSDEYFRLQTNHYERVRS